MRKHRKTGITLAVLALVAALASANAVYAESEQDPAASLSGRVTILNVDGTTSASFENAVVFLDGQSSNLEKRRPTIDVSQRGAQFAPRILPLTRNSTVRFLNDDDVYHNVFSLSRAAVFDLGIYAQGTSKDVTFDKTGLVNVYCNIHPEMVARILVLNNHWFTTTAEDGFFRIDGVPPGEYTLRVWHELGGQLAQSIKLAPATAVMEALTIQSTTISLSHKNKFGQPYREKY